jgi:hypothetical protein
MACIHEYLSKTAILLLWMILCCVGIKNVIAVDLVSKESKKLYIFHHQLTEQQLNFLNSLRTIIDQNELPFEVVDLRKPKFTTDSIEQTVADNDGCALTIGKLSLDKLLSTRSKLATFSTFVSKSNLDNRIKNYAKFGTRLSGVYQEQSFNRQLYLAKVIHQQENKSAQMSLRTFLSMSNRFLLPFYQQKAALAGFELKFDIISQQHTASLYLENSHSSRGVLLVLDDQKIFYESEMQSLLLKGKQAQVMLIGSTKQHSELAAVASVYTPSDSLAIESYQSILHLCQSKDITKPFYAKNFEVDVNQRIVEYLELPSLDNYDLYKKVIQLENKQNQQTQIPRETESL